VTWAGLANRFRARTCSSSGIAFDTFAVDVDDLTCCIDVGASNTNVTYSSLIENVVVDIVTSRTDVLLNTKHAMFVPVQNVILRRDINDFDWRTVHYLTP